MNKQISLKTKLVVILFISLLILTCLSIVVNYITITNYNKMLTNEIATNTEISAKSIDDVILQLKYTSESLATHSTVQNYLSKRRYTTTTAAEYAALNNCINDIYFARRSESCAEFIDLVSGPFSTGTYLQALNSISSDEYENLLKTAANAKGNLVFFLTDSYEVNLLAVRAVLQIDNLSLKHIGTFIIGVDISKLMRKVTTLSTLDNTIQLLHTEDGRLIFQSEEGFETLSAQYLNTNNTIRHNGKPYIKVTTKLSASGWSYTALVAANNIERLRNCYLLLFVIISVGAFAILLCISRNFIKELFKGFDELVVYIKGGKVGFDISESAKKILAQARN